MNNKVIKTKNNAVHKILSLFLTAAIVSAIFPATVIRAAAPQSVLLDTNISGYLSSPPALNEYYFTLPSAGSIVIQFTTPLQHNSESWRTTLYDTAKSLSLQTKNWGASYSSTLSGTKTETGEKVRLPAGTYRIDVSCVSSSVYSSLEYTFVIKFTAEGKGYEAEYNNTAEDASPLDLNTYISGNMGYRADLDYFEITLASRGSLNIYFSVSSIIDTGNWVVLLYDKNEHQLQMMRTGYGGTVSSTQRTNKLNKIRLPAGTYYIKIAPYVDTDVSYADYSIIAVFTPETTSAHATPFNNTRESATNILLNGAVTGNLRDAEDINYFAFETRREDNIKIIFEVPDSITQNTWTIYLLDDKGGIATYYAGQSGTVLNGRRIFESDTLALNAGKYYVAVYKFGSNAYSNEDFTLTVHSDTAPASSVIQDEEIKLNSSTEVPAHTYGVNANMTGKIKNQGDANTFEFGLTANGSIYLNFRSPGAIDRPTWIANIFDKNNNLLYTEKFGNGGTTDNAGLRTRISDTIRVPKGSYYVQVLPINAYNYSPESYRLIVVYTDESNIVPLNYGENTNYALYEREFNDTLNTANTLNIGDSISGNMSTPLDVDNFKVDLDGNGSFRFSFSTLKEVAQNDWVVKLYTNDMRVIAESIFGADGTTDTSNAEFKLEISSNIRLPKGAYYISVEAYNSINYSNKDYRLQALFTEETSDSYAKAFNNTPETADSVKFNADKIGNLSNPEDVNYYKLVIEKAESVQIKFSIDMQANGNYWYAKLFDSNLTELKSYKIGGGGSITAAGMRYFKTEIIQVTPGEYYIAVGTYSVQEYSNEDYIIKILDTAGRKADVYAYTADRPSSWAEEEVRISYGYDLVPAGYMKNFTAPITREEFCTLVVKLVTAAEAKPIEEVISGRMTFVDYGAFTDTNEYVVLAAHALGIIRGRGNGIFDPGGMITREEAAIMLMRVGTLLNINANASSLEFADKFDFQPDAVSAISYVSGCADGKNNRVMSGYDDGKFHPKDMYSREQAYMTVLRLYLCR